VKAPSPCHFLSEDWKPFNEKDSQIPSNTTEDAGQQISGTLIVWPYSECHPEYLFKAHPLGAGREADKMQRDATYTEHNNYRREL
jgi:hypothetical protein